MKKVIKFIRRNVLLLVVGIIIGGFTLVFADNDLIPSSLFVFDKTNLTEKGITVTATNVEEAIEELKIKADKKLKECPSGYNCSRQAYLPENDSNTYTQSEFVQSLKVGDYIQMTPSETTFQTDGSKTGYGEPTTINPQELTLWRVIRKNTNGTVDVVSEYVSSTDVGFRGVLGYSNYIGYLNELASHYENPTYTMGSRYMGYNGQTEVISNTHAFSKRSNTPWTSSTSSSTTAANESLGAGDGGYVTDYNLVKVAYGNASDSAKTYKVNTTTYTKYGLASRYYYYSSTVYYYFRIRRVESDGSVNAAELISVSNNYDWSNSFALRPILTLKAGITTSIGDGTKDTPYVLD